MSTAKKAPEPSDNPLVGDDTSATIHNVIYVLRALVGRRRGADSDDTSRGEQPETAASREARRSPFGGDVRAMLKSAPVYGTSGRLAQW